MKFGFCLPNFGGKIRPEDLEESAIRAENLGYDSVWATDHLIVPKKHAQPYGDLVEPLILLSFVAPRTETVGLGTSVIVVPQRNPLLLAKQVAALDRLSNGRVILGVGAGWLEEEFRYLNADFRVRGKMLDESIELMRAVWRDNPIKFSGHFFKIDEGVSLPKPRRSVPIWVGGSSVAAIRRAARLGDGWHPVGLAPSQLEKGVRIVRRSSRNVTVSVRLSADLRSGRRSYRAASGTRMVGLAGTRGEIVRSVEAYREVGVEYFVINLATSNSRELDEDLKNFSSEIVRSFK